MELEGLISLEEADTRLRDFVRGLGQHPEVYDMKEDDPHESIVLVFKPAGLQISFDKKHRVNVVHVYSEGFQGYRQYMGALPEGLAFHLGQDAARALLGMPAQAGGPVKAIIGDEISFWDRWDRGPYVLHLQYPEQRGSIKKITIMSPERAPQPP